MMAQNLSLSIKIKENYFYLIIETSMLNLLRDKWISRYRNFHVEFVYGQVNYVVHILVNATITRAGF